MASVDVGLYPSSIPTNEHLSGIMTTGESSEDDDCNLDTGQLSPVMMIGESFDGDLFCFVGAIDNCLAAA